MTKTVEEKDLKVTEELTDDVGRQAAKNQESHNTYVMNGRQAARNQEGHNTHTCYDLPEMFHYQISFYNERFR